MRVLWCLRRARRAQEWCLGCLLRCYALGSALSLGCPRACVPCRVVLGRPPLPLGCPRACVPCPLAVLRARPIFEGLAVLAEAASCGDRLRHTLFCQESAGAGTAAVGLRRDLDLSMPLIDVCGAMGARRLDPWALDFRCGYLESQSWREATRGAPNTASPVWQVASTGLRPSQLNSAQRVTAARAPAASLAFA